MAARKGHRRVSYHKGVPRFNAGTHGRTRRTFIAEGLTNVLLVSEVIGCGFVSRNPTTSTAGRLRFAHLGETTDSFRAGPVLAPVPLRTFTRPAVDQLGKRGSAWHAWTRHLEATTARILEPQGPLNSVPVWHCAARIVLRVQPVLPDDRYRRAMCQRRQGFAADQNKSGDTPNADVDLGHEQIVRTRSNGGSVVPRTSKGIWGPPGVGGHD